MRKQKDFTLHSNTPFETVEVNPEGKLVTTEKTLDFGRDDGKTFRLTEMSAMQKEKWNAKILSLMTDSFANASKEVMQAYEEHSATLAFAVLAKKSVKEIDKYLDLLNEHLYCYEVYDKGQDQYVKLTSDNVSKYIDEIATLQYLRDEAAKFNLSDFTAGGLSNSRN